MWYIVNIRRRRAGIFTLIKTRYLEMLLSMKSSGLKHIILILLALILGLVALLGLLFFRNVSEDPMSAFVTPSPSPMAPQATMAPATPVPTLSPEELIAREEAELMARADTDFMRNRVNMLILGWDQSPERDDEDSVLYRDEENNFRSDVLMLLTLDFEGNTAHLISIPRDTMAKVYNTKGHWKINAAFAKGGSAEGEGFDYAMKTVENLMGVPIDYYAGVNMEGLKAVVDAMGGVDYEVDREITINGRTLTPGMQHMDGQQVLDYCRARKGYGTDVDRADRQQRMLFAIFHQLQSGNKLTTLPRVYLSVKDYIHTNLSVEQIAALAMFGMDLDTDTGLFRHTLEGKYINGTVYSGASFYVLDTQALKELMQEIFGVEIEVDYRYDYRYVDGEKAAAAGLAYADAAEYLCLLSGVDISQYNVYYYGYPYDRLALGAQELRQLCTVALPASAAGEEAEPSAYKPLLDWYVENTDIMKERVEAYAQMLYDYCIGRGIYQEHVEEDMLPEELYDSLPELPYAPAY